MNSRVSKDTWSRMANRYHWRMAKRDNWYRGCNRSNRCNRVVIKNAVAWYWCTRDNWHRVYGMHWMYRMYRDYRYHRNDRHHRD